MIHIIFYFLFNIIIIIIFTTLYYMIKADFSNTREGKKDSFIDKLSLAITIQSTVGLTDILPVTDRGKLLVNLQQLLSMGGFAVVLYYLKKGLK